MFDDHLLAFIGKQRLDGDHQEPLSQMADNRRRMAAAEREGTRAGAKEGSGVQPTASDARANALGERPDSAEQGAVPDCATPVEC